VGPPLSSIDPLMLIKQSKSSCLLSTKGRCLQNFKLTLFPAQRAEVWVVFKVNVIVFDVEDFVKEKNCKKQVFLQD